MNIILSSYFPDGTVLTKKTLDNSGTDVASMNNKAKFRAIFEEIAAVYNAAPEPENLIKEIEMKELYFNKNHQDNIFDHKEENEEINSMEFIDEEIEPSKIIDCRRSNSFYFIDARDILELSSRQKVDDNNRRREEPVSKKNIGNNVKSSQVKDCRRSNFYFIDARDILELSSRQKVKTY